METRVHSMALVKRRLFKATVFMESVEIISRK